MTGQVSPMRGHTGNGEMSVIGYIVAVGALFVLLPVWPFILFGYLVYKLVGGGS